MRRLTLMNYEDFDLKIEPADGAQYRARVLKSPSGEAGPHRFGLPFSAEKLENLLLKIGRLRRRTRRIESPELAAARELGGALFDAVFGSELGRCLERSRQLALAQDQSGLRIRLRLQDVPLLSDLPWEFLYDRERDLFLSQSNQTSIVRYLELPDAIRPLAAQWPLRVLVLVAGPTDYDPLDVRQEQKNLHDALEGLRAEGKLAIETMEQPTLAHLRRALRRGQYHILHFIGHGGFDQRLQCGVLVFEDGNRRSQWVDADRLGTLLYDHRSLRLAVLNCCEGGRSGQADPFAGTAARLVRRGVPAVVAMQFEISDKAAITFSREFYAVLAESGPVDVAVTEARKAIYCEPNDMEWGTPVLYLRAADGVLFDLTPGAPGEEKGSTEKAQPAPIKNSNLVLDLGDGVKMELVLIPTGEFMMGSPEGEEGRGGDEGPQHKVRIAKPFYLGKCEVTVGQFRRFVEATGYRTDAEKGGQEWENGKKGGYTADSQGNWGWQESASWRAPGFEQNDSHPAVLVSWNDAKAFCDWLSGQTGQKVQLPAESEWEYACRAGTTTPFHFGPTISTDQANYDGTYTYGNGRKGQYRKKTTPVGSFSANAFGLYDMHGNVWEWCEDVWHGNYEGAPADGSAWTSGGDQSARVLRGGSWSYDPRLCRAAARSGCWAAYRFNGIGVRVAMDF